MQGICPELAKLMSFAYFIVGSDLLSTSHTSRTWYSFKVPFIVGEGVKNRCDYVYLPEDFLRRAERLLVLREGDWIE